MNRELILSTLANNAVFALEYFLHDEFKENLLKDGIELCDLIIVSKYYFTSSDVLKNNPEKFERIETIQKYYTHKQLLRLAKRIKDIQSSLYDILQKPNTEITISKIRSMQKIFNSFSRKFLMGETKKMRSVYGFT